MSAGPAERPAFVCPSLDPIGFLRAHHQLQFALCDLLEVLSADLHHRRACEFAAMAARYLEEAFPLHQADEEIDLREALEMLPDFDPEDSLLLDLVEEGHRRDRRLADPVLDGLPELAGGAFPENPDAFVLALLQFAASLRRHIRWEEQVIVPLAAWHLPPEARAALLACMTERRSGESRKERTP